MKRLFITSLLTIATVAAVMAQCADYCGTWRGTTEGGPYSLPIVFHIEQNGDSLAVTWDSPMQKAFGLAATADIVNDTLCIDMPIVQASYNATLAGETLDGAFVQGGRSLRLQMTQNSDEQAEHRQEAAVLADTNKPYHSEEVIFSNGDVTLAGTLTLPNTGSRFPAVVLVVGSGSLDRDENIFGHKGHLLLADALSRNGFAVLRYDKRGVGESTGGKCTDPIEELAQDAMAAVRVMSARPEVDASRIGILGHSEGGIIAIMNAAHYPDEIAYIVSMAGVGVPGYQFALKQKNVMDSLMGVERTAEEKHFYERMYTIIGTEPDSVALHQRMLEFLNEDPFYQEYLKEMLAADTTITASDVNEAMIEQSTEPETCRVMQYDPAVNLQRIKCPMLAVNGALDSQVDCEDNLGAISRFAPHATVVAYENLNHLFQTCSPEVSQLNYVSNPETMAPVVIEDIVAWLLATAKP